MNFGEEILLNMRHVPEIKCIQIKNTVDSEIADLKKRLNVVK